VIDMKARGMEVDECVMMMVEAAERHEEEGEE
jgi:hypothetical protein